MMTGNENYHKSDREKSSLFNNKNRQFHSASSKMMKKVEVEGDFDIDLIVSIDYADGIDELPSSKSAVTSRFYRAVFWVHPEEQYYTKEVFGDPNPVWRQKHRINLAKFRDCRFLYVEVLRFNSDNDPGTSNGVVSVGRAQIPLPTLSTTAKGGRFGLVRLDGSGYKAEGHLALSMKLEKFVY